MSGGAVNYGKGNIEGPVSAKPRPSEGRCGPRSRPEAHWPGRAGVIGNYLIVLPFLISLQIQPEASKTSENLPSPSAQLSLGQSFVQSHFQAQYR